MQGTEKKAESTPVNEKAKAGADNAQPKVRNKHGKSVAELRREIEEKEKQDKRK